MNKSDCFDIENKKAIVIEAGKKLLETGLIARTWGNVSYRIDATSFLITPSGRDYLSITPEEIVTVKISDLSYEGSIKPSSEKGVHANVYALFPDMNFVIHTHQVNASAISATGLKVMPVLEGYPSLTQSVPIASYALPGTKKLMGNVAIALKETTGKAVIMQNHGALCFGKNFKEAFETAEALERASQDYLYDTYQKLSGSSDCDDVKLSHYALSRYFKLKSRLHAASEPIDLTNQLTYVDKKYRILLQTPETIALATYGIPLKPMLDDYAQIAGHDVVFERNRGAYCYGTTISEAEAVALVTQKNAKAFIAAALLDHVKPINTFESRLMRLVYKTKYSKRQMKEAL